MKDIKIIKDNYKELFECAGFEQSNRGAWVIQGKEEGTYLRVEVAALKGDDLRLELRVDMGVESLENNIEVLYVQLAHNETTAEIDRLFYPFLDKPLVWQKKWDFESVFDRVYGCPKKRKPKRDKMNLYGFIHKDPRVQAFSRLLFVMEELNADYKESKHYYYEIKIEIDTAGKKAIGYCDGEYKSYDPTGIFVFGHEESAQLFIRDNEQDLKTFFNI